MKVFNSYIKNVLVIVMAALFITACNKLELAPTPAEEDVNGKPTLAALLDAPSFSLLKTAATKAGLMATLADTTKRFTVFAPDNTAIMSSLGVTSEAAAEAYINTLDQATVTGLVSYHVLPQEVKSVSLARIFPNLQYPTIINPAPTVSAFLRLTTFPSATALGAWDNNVPIIAADIQAANGVIHQVAAIVAPPTVDLWTKIQTDPELTYLKAAIARADSGAVTGARLQDALSVAANPSAIGSNLTVFAPTDAAMKAFIIGAITQALMAQGVPAAIAQGQATTLVNTFGTTIVSDPGSIPVYGPQLAAVVTPTLAKGIVVYHVLASQSGTYLPPGVRVFSVNLPATASAVKTMLNSAVAAHPGVTVQATFVSPVAGISVVSAATVKGAANATASNIIIGRTTSDLHYVNGVMHKIDQVLRPQ